MSRYTNKKIKELEQEIKKLKQSLDVCIDLNEGLDKERTSYRRIIKYNTMLMLLMNLISSSNTDTDIDRIVKRNIQEYYRSMNNDLMQIPTNDKEEFDDEKRENNEWDGEEEFE